MPIPETWLHTLPIILALLGLLACLPHPGGATRKRGASGAHLPPGDGGDTDRDDRRRAAPTADTPR